MSAQPRVMPLRPGRIWLRRAPTAARGVSVPPARNSLSPARNSLQPPRSRLGSSRSLETALLLCGLLIEGLSASPSLAEAVQLQCRLGEGPWQPCRMEVQDLGLHWRLMIGDQRIEFRHSGDGAVRMQKGAGPWQPVTTTWQAGTSLCWDGVCARGDIPLD